MRPADDSVSGRDDGSPLPSSAGPSEPPAVQTPAYDFAYLRRQLADVQEQCQVLQATVRSQQATIRQLQVRKVAREAKSNCSPMRHLIMLWCRWIITIRAGS